MQPAFSRVNFAIVSRADRNGDAVKAAAYNAAARFDHNTRTFDFTRKIHEHTDHAVLLPPGASPIYADAATLWRAAEAAERRCDAQTARQVLISIPREVPGAERLAYATAIVAPWVADGAAAQIDIHCPTAADGAAQPHAHVLLTMRRVTDGGFAKLKCREWNQLFRDQDGRAERARIETRGNEWLAAHAITARVDLRSLAARGSRRTPEPQARPSEWQRWRREGGAPEAAPPSVTAVLAYRARRAALTEAVAAERRAAAAISALTERLAALDRSPPQKTATMASKKTQTQTRRTATPTWHLAGGGYDALTAAQQTEAQVSHRRWQARRPGRAQAHDLAAYVAYVQDRVDERPAQHEETDAAPSAAMPTGNRIAPASENAARARRARLLADLLREHYDTAWLPPSVADRLERVDLNKAARTATLRLRDGSAIVDHGNRITLDGPLTEDAANEIAEAAGRHGWPTVKLTGSTDFRDRVATSLALREPPIGADHPLSPAAREQVRTALAARATAALPPLDRAALAQTAATDPAAAARALLDAEDRRTTAALAGRPTGERDADTLTRPREAAVTAARDAAVCTAVEAAGAADGHRREHGVTARLFDSSVRRRQAALDAEATRLGRVAGALDRHHERDRATVGLAARREAKAAAEAMQDWQWSAPVRTATARAAALDRVRQAVDDGDADTIRAAASGDAEGAIAAATARDTQLQREKADALTATDRPETRAVDVALAAERKAGADPTRLAAARLTTAAVLGGDADVREALERGRTAEAARLAADWQRRREQERAEMRRTAQQEQTATAAPGTPGLR